jgi:hypothetical protein
MMSSSSSHRFFHLIARAAGLLVVLGLVLAVGCAPPKKRQFNNKLARWNSELAQAGKAFYKAISPLGEGQIITVLNAKAALLTCKSALGKVQDEFAYTRAPANTVTGRVLRARYREFLEVQQKIYDECFVKIVDVVENKDVPNGPAKWAVIDPLFQKAVQWEKESFDKLMEAQKEYADKHGFQPK